MSLVIASILNWNTAETTITCVNSILRATIESNIDLKLLIVDNGSDQSDFEILRQKLKTANVTLIRNDHNKGFAGGHNAAIDLGISINADYVWLINSDCTVEATTLTQLIKVLEDDSKCGVVSPVVMSERTQGKIDFCGAMHDWVRLESVSFETIPEARSAEQSNAHSMWVLGTAPLFRMAAIRQIGNLNEDLFAYYEDNDICARLSRVNWVCRMAFDARITHSRAASQYKDRPAYYFYLMARNSIIFWSTHARPKCSIMQLMRLVDRNILTANQLYNAGFQLKAESCLLGVVDGIRKRGGIWNLERGVPFTIKALRIMLWLNHRKFFVVR